MHMVVQPSREPLPRCKIFVHDPLSQQASLGVPDRYVPARWPHNQYAAEHYLWESLRSPDHPWRVARVEDADVVYLAFNHSMLCFAGKPNTLRRQLKTLAGLEQLWPSKAAQARLPLFVPAHYAQCPVRSFFEGAGQFTLLSEFASSSQRVTDSTTAVSPFVVSEPAWLVAPTLGADRPASTPWDERTGLVFTAGHVPKVYLNPTRYLIWRQLRRDRRALAVSPTLLCSVGTYSVCNANLTSKNDTWLKTYCHEFCGATLSKGHSDAQRGHNAVKCGNNRLSAKKKLSALQSTCKRTQQVHTDYTQELEGMQRDTRRLPHSQYLREAMRHRFCLVAPGDFVSTHKVSEAIALGGAGGCIPLLVLPSNRRGGVRVVQYLPYSRWLDYCTIAFFVREETARTSMAAILARLANVSAAEAAAKHAALSRVREAFVFRPSCSPGAPCATEHILGEMCDAAVRGGRRGGHQTTESAWAAGGDHQRCVLG